MKRHNRPENFLPRPSELVGTVTEGTPEGAYGTPLQPGPLPFPDAPVAPAE